MKEKRRYRRVDPLSTFAVLGCLAVLLFEFFFVFELYNLKAEQVEPYLPAALKPLLAVLTVPSAPAPDVAIEPVIDVTPVLAPPAAPEPAVAPPEAAEPAPVPVRPPEPEPAAVPAEKPPAEGPVG